MAFETPGVYVQEISLFPPSVADVATAIPAFIGYTETAELRGRSLINKPTRIRSLLEYRELFGGGFEPSTIEVVLDASHAVTSVSSDRFYLFDSLRLFYDNGGGACYIVSVGTYQNGINAVKLGADADKPGLLHGLAAVEKVDEPTILLFPDACRLAKPSDLFALQQKALQQCARLQDRVAVFDLYEQLEENEISRDVVESRDLEQAVQDFRNGIGINHLKYGAAYTPWLYTAYPRTVRLAQIEKSLSIDAKTKGDQAGDGKKAELIEAQAKAAKAEQARQQLKEALDGLTTSEAEGLAGAYGSLLEDVASVEENFLDLLGFLRGLSEVLAPHKDLLDEQGLPAVVSGLIGIEMNKAISGITELGTSTKAKKAYPSWEKDLAFASNKYDYQLPKDIPLLDQLKHETGEGETKRSILGDLDDVMNGPQGLLAFVEQTKQKLDEAVATAQAEVEETSKSAGGPRSKLETLSRDPRLNGLARTALAALEDLGKVEGVIQSQTGHDHRHLADKYRSLAETPAARREFLEGLRTALQGLMKEGSNSRVSETLRNDFDAYIGDLLTKPDMADLDIFAIDKVFFGSSEPDGHGFLPFIEQLLDAAETRAALAQQVLYDQHPVVANLVAHIERDLSRVPPSGAIAGVYAMVDGTRGVWKAPANVSLSSVLGPAVVLDDADQRGLNVDPEAGKSINAIRSFSGKGTVVWGARTLAGNDNEWRYVPVRRFFNLVEESVKKATAWAVFEPNDASLWSKVKGMVDAYLHQKWRDGALAGATPQQAFYVKVGLGTTMTAQDVLEGRLIVEIGMAVVRPAEFIVLQFSHKMQES